VRPLRAPSLRPALAVALALAAQAAWAVPAQAVLGGAVDARFADCGQATGLVPRDIAGRQFSYGAGAAMVAQQDGKIVVAGPAARGMGATRFNADGTLDKSFGGDGVAHILSGTARFDQTQVTSVAVQPDGKVVAAGWLRTQSRSPSAALSQRFLIARFLADGEPDTAFSEDGLVEEAPGAASASAHAIAPAGGGALIVAGQVDERFALVRYRDDGTVDPAFGDAGIARVTTATRPTGRADAVSVRPDGRIVTAGHTSSGPGEEAFTVARLTAAGAPDPSFGGTGTITETFDQSSFASDLVQIGDGRIYAVGTTTDFWGDDEGGGTTRRAAIVRYLENGDRDDSFAGDGSVLDALGGGLYALASPTDAALDSDGRLTLTTIQGGLLVRYTPDGARDTAFGRSAGLLRISGAPSGESLIALPDGSLILGGGNARQGSRPPGFEFGPAIMRLAGSGQALERAAGQPGACFVRVRNTSLPHLLRTGRTARFGKVIVGAFLTEPGTGVIQVTGIDRRGAFGVGRLTFDSQFAGSTAFEVPMRERARRRLRRVSSVRIVVNLIHAGTDLIAAGAERTLRR
jgi:uncharacterized delta-60 repeat protein